MSKKNRKTIQKPSAPRRRSAPFFIYGTVFAVLCILLLMILHTETPVTSGEEAPLSSVPAPEPVTETAYISLTAPEAHERLQQEPWQILDVREDSEYQSGHLQNSLHIPMDQLSERATQELDKTAPVLVYCRSGNRSAVAAEILINLGFDQVINLDGGIVAWQSGGYAVQTNE